jgi:hypothetical protein
MPLGKSARWLPVLLAAAGITSVGLMAAATPPKAKPPDPAARATAAYVAGLDPARFERNGTRYSDPDLSPYRILPTLTDHDITYHYDFARLATVEDRLRGVHRRTALRALYEKVTAGADTPTDRHLAVLRFLHRASFHNRIQPTAPDGQPVYDPLVLLELGEMRCGHANRVAVDLFRAAGTPARLVQVACHVLAEVWYDGGWHYFDADIFGDGETARLADGRVPSVAELADCPERLDRLTAYWEPDHGNPVPGRKYYPSWFYFAAAAYERSGVTAGFIEKRATEAQEDASRRYGWEYYAVVPDPDRRLSVAREPRFTPAPPVLTAVRCDPEPGSRRLTVTWERATAAAGYRVFVGRSSRGWTYDGPSLPTALMGWKTACGPWRPEMYPARYRLPPADVARVDTQETGVTLALPPAGPVYVTVMAYDAYGKSIGRALYPMAEELCVPQGTPGR